MVENNPFTHRTHAEIKRRLQAIEQERTSPGFSFEAFFLKHSEQALNIPEDVRYFLKDVAPLLQGWAKKVDYLVVTGRSGKVSQAILKGARIPEGKILTFGEDVNGDIYKIDSPQREEMAEIERFDRLAQAINERIPQDMHEVNVGIMDEVAGTFAKTWGYYEAFKSLSQGMIDRDVTVHFVVLAAETLDPQQVEGQYFHQLMEELQYDLQSFFLSLAHARGSLPEQTETIYTYFRDLTLLVSALDPTHPMHATIENIPSLRIMENAVDSVLDQLQDYTNLGVTNS